MSNAFLYVLTVLIWGSTWFAIEFQLGVVAPEVSVVYRYGAASLSLFAWLFVALVPSAEVVVGARIVVFASLIFGLVCLFRWRPTNAVEVAESRAPDFAGRLQTWSDSIGRGESSSMLNLLGGQAEPGAAPFRQGTW